MRLIALADLHTADEAERFAEGLTHHERAAELPLPARFARFGLAGAAEQTALEAASAAGALEAWAEGPLSLFVDDARGEALLAGSAPALHALARRLPAPLGPALASGLERYERPVSTLRFADGERWELAERTRVMGVLNVTPDSFSDGGLFAAREPALEQALAMAEEGADIIDVGGESTRPGASAPSPAEERARVLPVLEALRASRPGLRISVDTRRADVAAAALDAGADLVNDVSGLADPEMGRLVAERGVPIALMHMRGTPETMQSDTRYEDLLGEVLRVLARSVARAREAGIADDRILVDPGIGFGKSASGNEWLLRRLATLRSLGQPILVGASRKSFIGRRTGVEAPAERLAGSLAVAAIAAFEGAGVVRVHDVRATREALAMADALRRAAKREPSSGGPARS